MESTILLAKVFGTYFTVMALIMLIRKDHLRHMVSSLSEAPAARFVVGVVMFIGGNFYIHMYQDFSSTISGLLSVLAWVMLVKGLVLVNLSNSAAKAWFDKVSKRKWVAILPLLIGLYLLNSGFAWGLV